MDHRRSLVQPPAWSRAALQAAQLVQGFVLGS